MSDISVGVQLHPQRSDVKSLLEAAREAEHLGLHSVWVWDHFFPIFGEPDGTHFECWTLLASIASATERVTVGPLVTSVTYRNPDLLADMARTLDHVSDGRAVLGLGAGWFERDHDEYGFELGPPNARVARFADAVERVRRRLPLLDPRPVGALPLLLGGKGPRVLEIVARHADAWNAFAHADEYSALNAALTATCERVGRDPADIERTVLIAAKRAPEAEAYVEAGATNVIIQCPHPFDLSVAEDVLRRLR